ncbi:MAG TPA: cytochrome ubiquinol oxidase subunit I [Anaerolineales bacterium]|jgi:cytochrome d ubiquinol oxidase subunit I|nr:cytochrome ubiquinol oxidase subunit I [Anaerolineales bacterium]
MDPVSLSRLQFGLTTIYHFLFVPLTLGLGWFVAYMQTRYYQTQDEPWRKMAKFWGKLFLINFAIGVVTGIVQEFQFGMNWSEYSRYVGDIFGAPLAIEALMAFFLESTFLGIWIFGEGRVPKKVHLGAIWMVAIASNLSALWILLANGWMQHPVGYIINEVTGRAELVDFLALITNPKGWLFFWHTIAAGFATASFLILGISAYHIARRQYLEVFKPSFRIAALVGLIAGILVFLGGHTNGQFMYETQPMKFAAIEAHWETSDPASFSILTIGDLTGKREIWSIRVPRVLSLLACNNLTCEVRGVDDIQKEYQVKYGPGNYIPLIVVTYWAFRIMMTIGLLMMALSFFFLFATRKPFENAKWMKWVPWVIALPYIANTSGWILTEMGRQPWIVQGLLTVEKGVSPNLTTLDLLISLIGYIVVYGSVGVAMAYLMKKYAVAGPDAALHESVDVESERGGFSEVLPIGAQD